MKMKLFYLEADGLDSANIAVLMQSFQQLILEPVAGDERMVAAEAPTPSTTEEKTEVEAKPPPITEKLPDIVDDSPDTSDQPPAFDWPASLREVAELLDTRRTSWRKVDREIR